MPPRAVSPTIPAALAGATVDPAVPVLTYYDDATGERTELSGATLANWVAKTANLLTDGLGLAPPDLAAVRLPPHWQCAAVLLGCWSAGLAVDLAGTSTEGMGTIGGTGIVGPSIGGPSIGGTGTRRAGVAFVTAERLGAVTADETFALALAPMAAPFRPGPPAGALDYVVEVRSYADTFVPTGVTPQTVALADGSTHEALLALARQRLAEGDGVTRLLIDGDATPDPVDWLIAPLVAGCSIVLCRNLDPAKLSHRLATERATPYPPRSHHGERAASS